MPDLQFHEVANFWPLIEDEEFDSFVEDIRTNGQRVPIELWEGKIIDGRNRYRACLIAGVKPKCVEVDLSDKDVVAYVRSLNDVRRHMTISQLGMCAARARQWYDEEAKKRQLSGLKKGTNHPVVADLPLRNTGKARDAAGKAFGVSGRVVDAGTRVLEKGSDKLIKAVDSGKIAVTTAERFVGLPHKQQDELAESAKHTLKSPRKPTKVSSNKTEKAPKGYDLTELCAMNGARCAITQLEAIPQKNEFRDKAFTKVEKWIQKQRSTK